MSRRAAPSVLQGSDLAIEDLPQRHMQHPAFFPLVVQLPKCDISLQPHLKYLVPAR